MDTRLKFVSTSTLKIVFSGSMVVSDLSQDFEDTLNRDEKEHFSKLSQIDIRFKELERIDTAGLAYLINIVRFANENQISVTFVDLPDKLLSLAELSGVFDLFRQTDI